MNETLTVEVANRHGNREIDEMSLAEAVRLVIVDKGIETGEVSISIVDDREIHRLNVEYLDHDYPTDVLSFTLEKNSSNLAGEIIVSFDTAENQAPLHQLAVHEELLLYVIHGALHLVGYDDKQPDARRVMRRQESHYMKRMGINFNSSDRDESKKG